MLKKLSASAAALIALASYSMAAVNFDEPKANNFPDEISNATAAIPLPAAPEMGKTKPSSVKEWTIMVFVNGKNNLEKFAFMNINQMEKIGSSDKVNIVVQLGRMNTYDHSDGKWVGTRRYLIKKGSKPKGIYSPVVQDIGKVDMGSYQTATDFGKWAKATYPANHYMFIIWNHGAGWIKSNKSAGIEKGISYDDETNNHINTPQMGQILKDMGGVDVYGSDACLMQMAEVDYEIKDYAQIIVGSEETEPGDGYTYDTFLGPIVANPAMSAEDVAKTAVNAYADHYVTLGQGSTQSYVKSAAIPGLLSAVNEFAYAITTAGEKDLAKKAMGAAQAYAYPENKDLYNFTQLVVAETTDAAVKDKGNALMGYISNTLVGLNRATSGEGGDYTNSHGIAIYMPPSAPADGYMDLAWAKYSNWDEFIGWYQKP